MPLHGNATSRPLIPGLDCNPGAGTDRALPAGPDSLESRPPYRTTAEAATIWECRTSPANGWQAACTTSTRSERWLLRPPDTTFADYNWETRLDKALSALNW